jgi:mercuric reductase
VEEIIEVQHLKGLARFLVQDSVDAKSLASAVSETGYEASPVETEATRASVPKDTDFELVIVGGGSAGFAAAIRGAELGARVALVNAGTLGGTCVNVGCIPSKTLIRAAEVHHRARHHRFGGIVCQSQTSDWPLIHRQKDELVEALRKAKYWDVLKAYPQIKLIEGRARVSNDHTVQVDGEIIRAGRIVITTGSQPFIPPIPGLKEVGYLDNESVMALEKLPATMIVLGAGAIGLELAQAYTRFGVKVTIHEVAGQIAPLEDADGANELEKHLRTEGIEICTCSKVIGARTEGGEKVILSEMKDGQKREFRAQALLVATGRRAVTAGLGLEEAGVRLAKRGDIEVNEHLETSVPDIYAAGDCTNLPQLVYIAAAAGHLAAENALEGNKRKLDLSVVPRVTFTDPQLAAVGQTEKDAREKGLKIKAAKLPLEHVPRALAARDTRGLIKLIAEDGTGRILGAHIVAPEAGEMIMEPTLAMKFGLTVEDIVSTLHPYLTLTEGIKLCAQTFDKDVLKLSCCAG